MWHSVRPTWPVNSTTPSFTIQNMKGWSQVKDTGRLSVNAQPTIVNVVTAATLVPDHNNNKPNIKQVTGGESCYNEEVLKEKK